MPQANTNACGTVIQKGIHKMKKARYLVRKYASDEAGAVFDYDEALRITCCIEKIYFKHHGELMPNALFNEVFDLIYAA